MEAFDKVLEILKTMDYEKARPLVDTLIHENINDKAKLKYIKSVLTSLRYTVPKLTDYDCRVILESRKLNKEEIIYIAKRLRQDNFYDNFLNNIPLSFLEKIDSYIDDNHLKDRSTKKLKKIINEFQRKNRLEFRGFSDVFDKYLCIDEFIDREIKGYLFTDKEIYNKNEKIKLFIKCENHKSVYLKAKINGKNLKIHKELSKKVILNEYYEGFYEFDFVDKEGILSIELFDSNIELLTINEIYIFKTKYELPLSMYFWNLEKNDEITNLTGKVRVNSKEYKENLKYEIICASCFTTLKEGEVKLQDEKYSIDFKHYNHHDNYFLILKSEKNLYGIKKITSLKTNEKLNDDFDVELSKSLNKQFLTVTDKNSKYSRVFLKVSAFDLESDNKIKEYINSINYYEQNRELDKEFQESLFASDYIEDVFYYDSISLIDESYKLSLTINSKKIVNLINVKIVAFNNGKIEVYSKHFIVNNLNKDLINPNLPIYMSEKDYCDSFINVYSNDYSTLFINGKKVEEYIKGEKLVKYRVVGNQDLKMVLKDQENKVLYSTNWKFNDNSHLLEDKLVVGYEKEKFDLECFRKYDDIEEFLKEFTLLKALKYPWGCSEQTSAKIVLLYMVLRVSRRYSFNINEDKIYYEIESGFRRLMLFKKRDSTFSFWINCESSEFATKKVLENLSYIFFADDDRLIRYKQIIEELANNLDYKLDKKEFQDMNLNKEDIYDFKIDFESLKEKEKNLAIDRNGYFFVTNDEFNKKTVKMEEILKFCIYFYKNNIKNYEIKIKEILTKELDIGFFDKVLSFFGLKKLKKKEKYLEEFGDKKFKDISLSILKSSLNSINLENCPNTIFPYMINSINCIIGNKKFEYEFNEVEKFENDMYKGSFSVKSKLALFRSFKHYKLSDFNVDKINVKFKEFDNRSDSYSLIGNSLYNLKIEIDQEFFLCPILKIRTPYNLKPRINGRFNSIRVLDDQTYEIPIENFSTMHLKIQSFEKGRGDLYLLVYDMYNVDRYCVKKISVKI